MYKQLFVGLICFTSCFPAFAEEQRRAPIVEVFGGYSLLHSDVELPNGSNINGWNATTNANILPWLGATADFSGYYFRQTVTFNNLPAPAPPSLRLRDVFNFHNFLFGPQVSYRRPRSTIFAHSLFGTAHGSFTTKPLSSEILGGTTTANRFSFALGGGIDLNVSRRFAVRPIGADYLRNSGAGRNSFRYSGGVVFRFGRH